MLDEKTSVETMNILCRVLNLLSFLIEDLVALVVALAYLDTALQ
jgi:hypothetical protein